MSGGLAAGRRPSAVLLTGNVLCNNPRVIKEADTLAGAGWDVEVLGAWITDRFVDRDRALMAGRPWRFTPVASPDEATRQRLRTRAARIIGSTFGIESGWQLGYVGPELLTAARVRRADLFVAHSEQGLWAADHLARAGRRIGVDMEDWFSEDLLADSGSARPVGLLRRLEHAVLAAAVYRACPSRAMSEALASTFACERPTVVYNAFPWKDRIALDGRRVDRADTSRPSIHWYSQTLGPGRGLETLAAALLHVEVDADLHLRGAGAPDFRAALLARMPERWRGRVFFHDLVSNNDLLARIAEHDIGFAGEVATIPSRDLTVTNKVLHYLLAGLAVVASDTAGHREVAAQAGAGVRLFAAERPEALASCLNSLLQNPSALASARATALTAAERCFSWERQEPALLEAFDRALGQPARTGN